MTGRAAYLHGRSEYPQAMTGAKTRNCDGCLALGAEAVRAETPRANIGQRLVLRTTKNRRRFASTGDAIRAGLGHNNSNWTGGARLAGLGHTQPAHEESVPTTAASSPHDPAARTD